MAEPVASTPIRYSFGADEHLFAEVSDSMSLEAFFKGMAVTRAVERAYASGKLVASVCHGAAGLVSAKRPDGESIVKDRKVNAFTNEEEVAVGLETVVPFLLESRLRELGAEFVGMDNWQPFAVQDGQLITGQNPQSSQRVADMVLAALKASAGD